MNSTVAHTEEEVYKETTVEIVALAEAGEVSDHQDKPEPIQCDQHVTTAILEDT